MYIIMNKEDEVIARLSTNNKRLPILSDEVVQQIGEDTERGFNRIFNSYLKITSLYKDELLTIDNGFRVIHVSDYNKTMKSYIIDSVRIDREFKKPTVTIEAIDEVIDKCNKSVKISDVTFDGFESANIVLDKILELTDVTYKIDDIYYPVSPLESIVISNGNVQSALNQLLTLYNLEFESYVKADIHGNYDGIGINISRNLESEPDDLDEKDIKFSFTYGKNISNISKTMIRDFATRFYVRGATVEGGGYIGINGVTENGEGYLDYEEENDLYNYGGKKIETLLINDSITDSTALKVWAMNEIESKNLNKPTFKYEVDLLVTEVPFLSQKVLVKDLELGVTIVGKVLERTLCESNPSNNSIKIGNFKEVKLKTLDEDIKKELDKIKNQVKNESDKNNYYNKSSIITRTYRRTPVLDIREIDNYLNGYTDEDLININKIKNEYQKYTDFESNKNNYIINYNSEIKKYIDSLYKKIVFTYNKQIKDNYFLMKPMKIRYDFGDELIEEEFILRYIQETQFKFDTELSFDVNLDLRDYDNLSEMKEIDMGIRLPLTLYSFISLLKVGNVEYVNDNIKLTAPSSIYEKVSIAKIKAGVKHKVIIKIDFSSMTKQDIDNLTEEIGTYSNVQGNLFINFNFNYADVETFSGDNVELSYTISTIDFKLDLLKNKSILNGKYFANSFDDFKHSTGRFSIINSGKEVFEKAVSYYCDIPKTVFKSLNATVSEKDINSKIQPVSNEVEELKKRIADLEAIIKGGGA